MTTPSSPLAGAEPCKPSMPAESDVVITGVAVACPLGIGCESVWSALVEARSGVGYLSTFDSSTLPVRLAAEVPGFDPLAYVKPRKTLKVLSRDAQIGMTVSGMARENASLRADEIDPDRFGVVFAADTINPGTIESEPSYRACIADGKFQQSLWGTRGLDVSFPLGMLKLLPNMLACHISIAQDARAHNNTLYTGDVSGLLALGEAASVIRRGHADVMLSGGASSRTQPMDWVRDCIQLELSRRDDDPAGASRPFELNRDGLVRGEGGAAFILESRQHAQRRGARILARVLGWSSGCDTRASTVRGGGLHRAIREALRQANLTAADIDHVNAHGLATRESDRIEARVLNELLPGVPVTAPKSFFGNLFAASGSVETLVSLLALDRGLVPVTLNYNQPDPQCRLPIVHGEARPRTKSCALVVNMTRPGQAAALVLGLPD
jgi:3-oxoacyl-[acyl-carrier-protein] synthase II